MRRWRYISNSVEETEAAAAELVGRLTSAGGTSPRALCIALEGEMGAGKTQFVRGLVTALGGDPRAVFSPTFMLLNVYAGSDQVVYHLDAYRVSGADDFEAIGFEELLQQEKSLVVLEWASRVLELLPTDRTDVRIRATGETQREIEIETSAGAQ